MPISEVYNMDCVEYMKTLPDNYFSLGLCDPPYGIKEDGRNNHTRSKLAKAKDFRSNVKYDNGSPEKEYFDQLIRVTQNQIIWGANHFISKMPFDSSCWIIWDKDNGASDFADCELAWTSFNTAVRLFKFKWAGMLQGDMKNKEIRIHPNQKAVQLYKWILNNYAKEGDTIFDSHLGSASSRIAAHDLGYSFIGTELDNKYFKEGEKRFQQHIAQLNLF